jgi:hypothetical protein
MLNGLMVRNIESRNGNKIANQFVIDYENTRALQSYESLVLSYDYSTHTLFIGNDYNYSNTTRKYVNLFLRDYLDFKELSTKELAKLEKQKATAYTLTNGLTISLQFEQ